MALHVIVVAAAGVIATTLAPPIGVPRVSPPADEHHQRLVFLAPALRQTAGGGGGGGGNQQSGPNRRAQGVGPDTMTVRVRKPRPPTTPFVETPSTPVVEDASPLPAMVLEATPLASGLFDQSGLPTEGETSGLSTGSGSGGGVDTGTGTGTGSGQGPGLGPGSGGGTGGGVYRPGGGVSVPRLITQVAPKYTTDALRIGIQGTVVLDVVVAVDGRASRIRVVRSLDRGGLDDEAVAAVAQWRFEPGRLAGAPVDVLVTIMVDFWIR